MPLLTRREHTTFFQNNGMGDDRHDFLGVMRHQYQGGGIPASAEPLEKLEEMFAGNRVES